MNVTLTTTDLQQLFLDGQAYASRPFCLSTDSEYLAKAAAAMPFLVEELMRRRREADVYAEQQWEREREVTRLRRVIRDLELAGLP